MERIFEILKEGDEIEVRQTTDPITLGRTLVDILVENKDSYMAIAGALANLFGTPGNEGAYESFKEMVAEVRSHRAVEDQRKQVN